jgi:hypothetical protein
MTVLIKNPTRAGQREHDTAQCKTLAHLMTILSEISSSVLPYALKILVQNESHEDSTQKTKNALGSIVYFERDNTAVWR